MRRVREIEIARSDVKSWKFGVFVFVAGDFGQIPGQTTWKGNVYRVGDILNNV